MNAIAALLVVIVVLACAGALPDLKAYPSRGADLCPPEMFRNLVSQTDPIYPVEARRSRRQGWVALSGIVDLDGWVRDARVLDSWPTGLFDDVALGAFSGWRYASRSAPCEIRLVLRFQVETHLLP